MAEDAAEGVLRLVQERGPRCGRTSVVLVDGPAGSGKTTLAGGIEEAARVHDVRAAVVHMDDLYAGWEGLREGGAALTEMLRAVGVGEPARYRRFDWVADRYAETVTVPEADVLVVEGVGSARSEHLDLVTVLVWVEEPDLDERLRRGLARDGEQAAPQWHRWMAQEQDLFAEVRTHEHADVLVDGRGRLLGTRGTP